MQAYRRLLSMRKGQDSNKKIERAVRIRTIRKNAGLTQEEFAERIGISVSAYKKVETGENQISMDCLAQMEQQMNISSDYVLFGKKVEVEEAWKGFMSCSERDKMFLLLRMLNYFTKVKEGKYATQDTQAVYDEKIMKFLKDMT